MNSVNISLATSDEVQDVGFWLRKGLRAFNQESRAETLRCLHQGSDLRGKPQEVLCI